MEAFAYLGLPIPTPPSEQIEPGAAYPASHAAEITVFQLAPSSHTDKGGARLCDIYAVYLQLVHQEFCKPCSPPADMGGDVLDRKLSEAEYVAKSRGYVPGDAAVDALVQGNEGQISFLSNHKCICV